MCDMRFWRGEAEPRAEALKRLSTGPSSMMARATIRFSTDSSLLFSALAMADFSVLAMSLADLGFRSAQVSRRRDPQKPRQYPIRRASSPNNLERKNYIHPL